MTQGLEDDADLDSWVCDNCQMERVRCFVCAENVRQEDAVYCGVSLALTQQDVTIRNDSQASGRRLLQRVRESLCHSPGVQGGEPLRSISLCCRVGIGE